MEIRDEYYKIVRYIELKNKKYKLVDIYNNDIFDFHENQDGNHIKINIPLINQKNVDQIWWYEDLNKLFEEGKTIGLLNNMIVHGSYGDYSYTNYSDLDLTIVLNQSFLKDINQYKSGRSWLLKSFYPWMFKVDPLQHHGPFYLWPDLLNSYSEDILPLDVYKYSWGLKEEKLEFNIIHDTPNQCRGLKLSQLTCQSLGNWEKTFFSDGFNMYNSKRYLSNIMILPAFYFTDIGRPVHKKESFALFKDIYSEAEEIIDIATFLRKEWPASPEVLGLIRACQFKLGMRGRTHNILQRLYEKSSISKIIRLELIPKVDSFCHSFLNDFSVT